MDDTGFEVTDLRTGEARPHPLAPGEPPGSRGPAPRGLLPRLALAAIILLAVGLAVALPFVRANSPASRRGPTPTPALSAGADKLYFAHGVPWGRLSIDGRELTAADYGQPYTLLEPPFVSLQLLRGHHTLDYRATPFPSWRCRLSVPVASDDTCPLLVGGRDMPVTGLPPSERILDLRATPAALAEGQLSALTAAVAAPLAAAHSSVPIAAGQQILAADGTPFVAQEPLTATLRFTLATPPLDVTRGPLAPCAVLCPSNALTSISDQDAWTVYARVTPTWQYTPTSGSASSAYVAPAAPTGLSPDGQVRVLVQWTGNGWQASLPPDAPTNPTCDTGVTIVTHEMQARGEGDLLARLHQRVLSSETPADGCLISFFEGRPDAIHSGSEALFIYRFGVVHPLLGLGQQYAPDLPPASGADEVLARRLEASLS